MKHAGAQSLDRLATLLDRVRALGRLTERTPGSFYLRSSAFLHFHEHPAGLVADLKTDGKAFTRLPVNSTKEQNALLAQVQRTIDAAITPR